MTSTEGLAPAAVNLAFTRFLFVVPYKEDEAFRTRLRGAGSAIARGFFNDYDAEGGRDAQPHETIQFLVSEGSRHPDSAIAASTHAVQVTGKYRPRLAEVDAELRRRLGDAAGVHAVDGAERAPRYTSPELHDFVYRRPAVRRSGRIATHTIILPIRKAAEWWAKPPLERQVYFYPHTDADSGVPVPGHAVAAEAGIGAIFKRLYYNPDGFSRPGEYDFITCFECTEADLATFARVHHALRDTSLNPEWRYVQEGPLWIGRRVMRW